MRPSQNSRIVTAETEAGPVQVKVMGIQYVKERVDKSKVHQRDLSYMEDILYGILEFEDPMPELNMAIKLCPGKYIIVVEGYNKPFLVSEWYAYFDNPDTRMPKFRHIEATRINPKTGNVEILVTRVTDDRRPTTASANMVRSPASRTVARSRPSHTGARLQQQQQQQQQQQPAPQTFVYEDDYE